MLSLLALLFFALMLIVIGYCISIICGLGRWNQIYYRLRRQYGGPGSPGGVMYGYYFSTPTLMFQYGPTSCTLKSRRRWYFWGTRLTEMKLSWPGKRIPTTIMAPPQLVYSYYPSLPLDQHESFGKTYQVTSRKPDLAKKFLTGGVKWQLEQLRNLNQDGTLLVSLDGYHLTVTKFGYLRDYATLDQLIRLSLELFQQLMLCQEEGIDFVARDDIQVLEEVKCPVCIAAIVGQMVVCRRCKTPHCQECWEYNGRCATFACNGTDFEGIREASLSPGGLSSQASQAGPQD